MTRTLIGLWVGALITLSTSNAAASSIVFSDSTFNLANYSQTAVFESGASVFSNQCSFCGDPGSALSVTVFIPGPTGLGAVGFVNNAWSYNPSSQGDLLTVDTFVDKNLIVLAGNTFGYPGPYGNTFRPLIQQGGSYYLAAIPGPALASQPGATGYHSIGQAGLTAASFQLFDFGTGSFGAGAPNFSGPNMQFGLAQIGQTGAQPFQNLFITSRYDNLSVTLTTNSTNPAAIPEPSTMLLLGTGILGVARSLRRRRAR